MSDSDFIRIRGARTHNLREVDVDLPLEKLTVITGVSGSGKSSLAFDTLFAEGRRRYLATVSAQTRALLQQFERPDVDDIEGLPPTLGIEQRTRGPRRRTTLATIAEIHDYLRLLYSRVGQLHCPRCHEPVTSQPREAIVEQALRLEDRQKVIVLSPVIRSQAGAHADVFARIVRDGFVRARVDGELVDAGSPPPLVASKRHSIEVVIDRLIIKDGIRSRLEESIDLALEMGQGQCLISHEADGEWHDRLYSSRLACAPCGVSFPSIEPADFSFNSVRGACPTCHGLGVIPSSVSESSASSKEAASSDIVCSTCSGRRLATLPNSVLITGKSITDFSAQLCNQAFACVEEWMQMFAGTSNDQSTLPVSEIQRLAAQHVLPELHSRLRFLCELGMDYLTLDRAGDSLSAGEFQRARLAASLGNQLTGACYVVDEPTAGLHPRDTSRLLKTLLELREQGNTVVLVEHDLDVIRQADHVIDMGPGAGTHGGRVIAVGSPQQIAVDPKSITGRELQRREADLLRTGQTFSPRSWLTLSGANMHNVRGVNLRVPLNGLVCVTGVSGSGKSSLIMQTLVPALKESLNRKPAKDVNDAVGHGMRSYTSLEGVESLGRLVRIDQSPLGRMGRSTPASYSGIWDEVRKVFAKTKESRLRGFTAKRFSPLSRDGRCSRCAGRGTLIPVKQSLVEWSIRCPDCLGCRFNRQTLGIRYRGMSVADVMDMSFETAASFFTNLPRLARPLSLFCELGLGYLKLGQPSTTLSGGEAQRVKLATELVISHESPATLFVLDEPTAGLHAVDVALLTNVLRRLIEAGHSVLVVEHNLDLIASADWLIDIGPEAGDRGGRIVVEGPPSNVAECLDSHTGRALRRDRPQ